MMVRARAGEPVAYSAVTWLAQEKAIALAVAAHLRRHPDGEEIYDVEVEDLGPVARDSQGAMVLERSDLTDRSEF
ncbi:MAG: hypothetical protein ACRD1K_08990 [Acidimicrobiales bacterium]